MLAGSLVVHKCEFTDVTLLASSRTAALELGSRAYASVAKHFGMTVSINKTTFMEVRYGMAYRMSILGK